jgi:hypothetical protein
LGVGELLGHDEEFGTEEGEVGLELKGEVKGGKGAGKVSYSIVEGGKRRRKKRVDKRGKKEREEKRTMAVLDLSPSPSVVDPDDRSVSCPSRVETPTSPFILPSSANHSFS